MLAEQLRSAAEFDQAINAYATSIQPKAIADPDGIRPNS